nr:hypothetical protein [Tanacetum cinerariifolium]
MEFLNPQEVILNGDPPLPTRIVDGVVQIIAPTTEEQRLAKKNELKARGTLLMALPDKHQLKFNIHKDAKSLMEAIEKSTNELVSVVPSVSAASSKATISTLLNVDSLSDAVIYSLFAKIYVQMEKIPLGLTCSKLNVTIATKEAILLGNADHQGTTGTKKLLENLSQQRKSQFDVLSYKTDLESQVSDKTGLGFDNHDKTCKGYHVVPPPYTGTFMPHKPDLVFHDVPTANWISDSEDETKNKFVPKHKEPSFVPTSEHVKTPKEFITKVEHPKKAENLRTNNQKSIGHKKNYNKKACFICRRLNHLIKD